MGVENEADRFCSSSSLRFFLQQVRCGSRDYSIPIFRRKIRQVAVVEESNGSGELVILLRLPTVQSYLTVNRRIKSSRFGSETLKSASLACIVLRSS